jgi:phage host-nuclease inhibitor protein Gam
MKKITEQEMVDLNQLREQYSKTIFEIGQLQYEKYELENQLKTIDSELAGLYGDILSNYKRQDDYLAEIREKYGEGNLDTQTGEILP